MSGFWDVGGETGTHVPALVVGALEQYSSRGIKDAGRGVAEMGRAKGATVRRNRSVLDRYSITILAGVVFVDEAIARVLS